MEEAKTKKFQVPIWHKLNLTVEEAMVYSGLGRDKVYELTNREDCSFVLWIGNRRLIKREAFEKYVQKLYSI